MAAGPVTRSPLLYALVGGVVAIAVIVAAVVLAKRLADDDASDAKRAAPGAADSVHAVDDGLHAAGTDELRKLGCDTALVLDMQRVLGGSGVRPGEPRYVLTCDVPRPDGAPSCERVAATYFAAVGSAEGNVAVRVMSESPPRGPPLCARVYAPSGADLGPLGSPH
jgi:hypothetical protein